MALIDNLVSYYKCDDNLATTVVIDSHGITTGTATTNTNNLSVTGGLFNREFNFNGSTEKIDLGTPPFDLSTDFTISGWFNVNSVAAGGKTIVTLGNTSTGIPMISIRPDGNKLRAFVRSDNNQACDAFGATVIAINTRYMGTVTWDASAKKLEIFLNSVSDASATNGSVTTASLNTYNIGSLKRTTETEFMNGELDEIGIWNRILSQTEIDDLYNSGNGLAYPFSAATLRLIKIAGTFVDKPIKTKVGGTFVDKPIKIKVGGTFQDA